MNFVVLLFTLVVGLCIDNPILKLNAVRKSILLFSERFQWALSYYIWIALSRDAQSTVEGGCASKE